MRIKPTLRRDGKKRCTFHVKVHVGLDEVVLALIYRHVNFGDSLTPKRQEAIKTTLKFMEDKGLEGCYSINYGVMEDYGPECREHVAKILPELA